MTPYYSEGGIEIWHGDCRDVLPTLGPVDAVLTDPPYGDTSLPWDVPVTDWTSLLDTANLWCFGSLRMFMEAARLGWFTGWRYGQEVVWEKHNGSSFHADRFKRVHELVVQHYRGPWADLYHEPPLTMDATARTMRRKRRPPHTGHIEASAYRSEDGGPRLMRSVLQVRSEHGRAVHPTQKPVALLRPIVTYSVPVGGLVLDPFAGAGSTLLAARQEGRRAIGIEADERYCEAAAERFAQRTLDMESAA